MGTFPVLGVFTAGAAFLDLRKDKIDNRYLLAGLLAGLAVSLPALGMRGCAMRLLGVALALLVMMPAYLAGALGAGDVKLLAAMAVFLTRPEWVMVTVTAFLLSALYGVGKLVISRSLHGRIHFAVPVFAGVLLMLGGQMR